jgi:hypothetical protein
MVFKATFNNISAISWQSVLLVGETGVPGENIDPFTRKNMLNINSVYFYILKNKQKTFGQ